MGSQLIATRMSLLTFFFLFVSVTNAFCPPTRTRLLAIENLAGQIDLARNNRRRRHHPRVQATSLYSGKGIAPTYTWHEEAFEIEITVNVPENTQAKDINFKVTPNSLDLRLKHHILLDPNRKLRGRIAMDGTYWVISDPDGDDTGENNIEEEQTGDKHREIIVTIEKQIRSPKDEFDIIEYDWNGLYVDDEDEVSYRKYDEPEELNVREYAASMGVDIDNIDMSLVDKSMFSSGLNLEKSALDSIKDAGLMKEVTEQRDGSEWITDDDGERKPFHSLGRGISTEEMQSSKKQTTSTSTSTNLPPKILSSIDSESSQQESVVVVGVKDANQTLKKETTSTGSKNPMDNVENNNNCNKLNKQEKKEKKDAKDPVDNLSVAKLKEVLRSRGLKVSGNKKELKERLRSEIQSMLVE